LANLLKKMGMEMSEARALAPNRWIQLVLGIGCMVMIANLQYGWTLFVNPMHDKYGWAISDIQWAFFLFVLLETWLVPVEGWFVDKFGPALVVLFGGALCGIAWVINSFADSLSLLYLGAAIGGVGAGAVYGTCVGNALKWFPDRRGLAAGLTAAGFGMGSAFTVFPIAAMIKADGYQAAFLWFGIGQGIICVVLSFFLKAPAPGQTPAAAKVAITRKQYAPKEMLKSPIFYVMYAMFVMMAAGGLMATAQLGPIAHDFKVADTPVSMLGITAAALPLALSLDRIFNGVTRPFFGWVSDHIGRENTMFIAFGLEAIGIWMMSIWGTDPFLFVILTALVFFAWGEIYSLFPATCTDSFGTKYATTNAGLLYTAKGTATALVPFTSILTQMTGSWHAVFITASILNAIAAATALLILKPLRAAHLQRSLAEGSADSDNFAAARPARL
jgi:OFA family oxalate/formate antiporter-like MFS transporter